MALMLSLVERLAGHVLRRGLVQDTRVRGHEISSWRDYALTRKIKSSDRPHQPGWEARLQGQKTSPTRLMEGGYRDSFCVSLKREASRGAESRWQTRRMWNSRLLTTRAPARHQWGTTDI